MKKKLLTCGPLMIDMQTSVDASIVEGAASADDISDEHALEKLIKQHHLQWNGKRTIDRAMSKQFAGALIGRAVTPVPGGSAYNSTITLKATLGDAVDVQFLGMVGAGPLSDMIEHEFKKHGVHLVPSHFVAPENPECGVSYVLNPEDGSRTYATYPGNSRALFHPEAIPELEKLVQESDVMMLSGSIWEKVNPALADELMRLRWKHGKELILTLPVDKSFSQEKAGHFQWLIPSANVVLSNESELATIRQLLVDKGMSADDVEKPKVRAQVVAQLTQSGVITPPELQQYNFENLSVSYEVALERLQGDFKKHQLDMEKARSDDQNPWKGMNTKQVGFITFGKEGARIVTADGIKHVDALPDPPGKLYKGGAGDTAFAGFLLGYLHGAPHELSAQIAMRLCNAKLSENSPHPSDPQGVLRRYMPSVTRHLAQGTAKGQMKWLP